MDQTAPNTVNNHYYNQLNENWYVGEADPMAVLRLEAQIKNPWINKIIKQNIGPKAKLVDIGCGGGLLSNYLAQQGHEVTGIDLSQSSLAIAQKYDHTKSVAYLFADGANIPLADASVDVVCAMDFLEHVEQPGKVVAEASRLLRPGGIFFYHTFNRNWLSYILVIKFMEWFVPHTPKNLHILRLFIRPKELERMMIAVNLHKAWEGGIAPQFFSLPFLWSVIKQKIHNRFGFKFIRNTWVGYIGYAIKK